jgi:hypothetical protein
LTRKRTARGKKARAARRRRNATRSGSGWLASSSRALWRTASRAAPSATDAGGADAAGGSGAGDAARRCRRGVLQRVELREARLDGEDRDAEPPGLVSNPLVCGLRHQDDTGAGFEGGRILDDLEAAAEVAAAEGGQAQVGDDDERLASLGETAGLASGVVRVRGLYHVEPGRGHLLADEAQHVGLVIHEQDRRPAGSLVEDQLLEQVLVVRLHRGHGQGGLQRGARLPAVLVELPGEVEHQPLGVDAVLEGLRREIPAADPARGLLAHVEAEPALAQAGEALDVGADPSADRVLPNGSRQVRGFGTEGGHVPDVAGDHAALAEDETGIALGGLDRQVARPLGEGDDLEDLEERQVLD